MSLIGIHILTCQYVCKFKIPCADDGRAADVNPFDKAVHCDLDSDFGNNADIGDAVVVETVILLPRAAVAAEVLLTFKLA